MDKSEYIIVNICGRFELQSALNKMPEFIYSKYKNKNYYPGYLYLGQQMVLKYVQIRMINLKFEEEPVSPTYKLA